MAYLSEADASGSYSQKKSEKRGTEKTKEANEGFIGTTI